MLTKLFRRDHQRYLQSPVAHWLSGFAEWLVATGYARDPAQHHVCRLKQILEVEPRIAPDRMFSVAELTTMFTSSRQQPAFRGTQRAFERFLIVRGHLVPEVDPGRFAPLMDAYRVHLREVRGLAAATTSQHLATITDFLALAIPEGGSLQDLPVEAVEQYVVMVSKRLKRQSLQHTIAHLRAFLRYCHNRELLRERLDIIDTPRVYRDELPPRALAWKQVQGLLRSIDRSSRLGCRDHAILYLMAYYGLRPSEVSLTLTSIDWEGKTLSVEQCKTRCVLVLPLSDQALRVLKRYLRCGRAANSTFPQLFLRGRSPAGPIERTAICDLYEKRARQSQLPLAGTSSYCLRHAFAMRLLDQGAGIKVIGDLLGHHTLDSTFAYLRLQTNALREVGLSVPPPLADAGRSLS